MSDAKYIRPGWLFHQHGSAIVANAPFRGRQLHFEFETSAGLASALERLRELGEEPFSGCSIQEELEKHGIVGSLPATGEPAQLGYSRQVRFLDMIARESDTGTAIDKRIAASRVGLVGLGGIGSWILLHLISLGVGRIVGADPDIVELSNLSRQVVYRVQDIGKMKHAAAECFVQQHGTRTEFVGINRRIFDVQDFKRVFELCDIVIVGLALDPNEPNTVILANALRAGAECGKDIFLMGQSYVGPICQPGRFMCGSEIFGYPAGGILKSTLFEDAVISPRVGIVASIAAWELVRYIANPAVSPLIANYVRLDTIAYERWELVATAR